MAQGLVWAFAGAVVSQGSVFSVAVINARLLGRADFGKLAVLQACVSTVWSFAAAGIGLTATKFVAQLAARDPARVGRILGLCSGMTALTGFVFAGALLIAAPQAAMLFKIAGLEHDLRLSSLQALFLTLNVFQVGALAGFSAFRRLARIGIIQGIVTIILVAAASWLFGLTGAVLAAGIAAATSWAQHRVALRLECRKHGIEISHLHALKELGLLWRFALPAALSGWVGGFAATAATAILVRQAGGPQSLAIFNAANTVRIAVLFVPGLVSRVSTPVLCKLAGPEDAPAYRRTFWQYLGVMTGVAAAAAATLAAIGPWVLWLFGKDFVSGRDVLAVLMIAAVLEAASVALFQTIYSHGLLWRQVAISSVWAITLVAIAEVLASRWGAMALALAYLGSWSTSVILYTLTTRAILAKTARPRAEYEEMT